MSTPSSTPSTQLILATVLALPREERERYLVEACRDRPELLAEMQHLLQLHEERHSTFPGDYEGLPLTSEWRSDRVGPYRLLQKLGEGGMGVVYLAEQTQPVQRRVALKIIKPGLDCGTIITRFENERQALARMDHPNIARVLDAGTTPTGQPYFVMELVQGVPLTVFADQHGLSLRARIELLIQVCLAIQHAHSKGILHRDIKPSNVLVLLVDGRPVPKVIDFGLAKALDQPLSEHSLHTQAGVLIGTPEYMSPEQAAMSGQDVDTRSDVYALGVLLYQLLTGGTPVSREGAPLLGVMDMLRRITHDEPEKPSDRLHRAGREMLARQVRGELDWITLKALEKERARRYQTANDLADDLQRYLAGDAVEAAPPTTYYRVRKFASRHRASLITGIAFLTLLLGATGVSIHLAITTHLARQSAEAEARITHEALDFLREDLLGQPGPDVQTRPWLPTRRNPTLAEAIDRAAARLHGRFPQAPRVEITIRNTLGNAYREMGALRRAETQLRIALDLGKTTLGKEHPDTLRTMYNLGWVLGRMARYTELQELAEQLLRLSEKSLGSHDRLTLSARRELGWVLVQQGEYERAAGLLEPTLAELRRQFGNQDEQTLDCMATLSVCYLCQGRYLESSQLISEGKAIAKEMGEDGMLFRLSLNLEEAVLAACQEQFGEADRLVEQVLREGAKYFDADHPETREAQLDHAWILAQAGRRDEAGKLLRKLYGNGEGSGEAPGRWANLLLEYGRHLLAVGEAAEAERVLREALPIYEKLYPKGWRLDLLHAELGGSLLAQKKLKEAEAMLQEAWSGLTVRAGRLPAFEKRAIRQVEEWLVQLERAKKK